MNISDLAEDYLIDRRPGENQQGTETKKSRIRAYPNDQSAWRVAVCLMMDINEDWITGNRYLSLEE